MRLTPLFALPLLAAASLPGLARAAQGPCAEPGGMPLAENGAIQCTVQTSITETSPGKSLSAATFGLVKEIQVRSALRLPISSDTLGTVLGEHAIAIPPQDIAIDIVFSDGRVLPAALTVAPSITVEGTDACELVATAAAVNLSRFDSGLPDWIDATVARYVNENVQLEAQLLEGANAGLANLKQQFCF